MKSLFNDYIELIFLALIILEFISGYILYVFNWHLNSIIALLIGLFGSTLSFYAVIYNVKENSKNLEFQLILIKKLH